MSSHREAPGVSKDPVADNTDTYAFVSPDKPDTVTIITNYIPNEAPAGGPNFYEFGDEVIYDINVDNDHDAVADLTFRFRFTTTVRDPNTFLYNTGPITSLDSANWNRRQFYTLSLLTEADPTPRTIASDLPCPPCNVGVRSTPDYVALADAAIAHLGNGMTVFAGQRQDDFFVDLGSIFDLGALRPFQNLHLIPLPATNGVNTLRHFNVHTIAIQMPITMLTHGGRRPTNVDDPGAVLGIWGRASRQRSTMLEDDGTSRATGPFMQVSRLGNPLFNEVIVPMVEKNRWNALPPTADNEFLQYVEHPELAALLPVLYPGVFPHLAGLSAPRSDLVAILLTGIPKGVVPGFQNYTGSTYADMLRLNVAIPPAANPNPGGLVAGDPAGFPNGRRVIDDVVTIELRAVAGLTYPLVDPSYQPDAAAGAITDGLTIANSGVSFVKAFPYLGTPLNGFKTPPA